MRSCSPSLVATVVLTCAVACGGGTAPPQSPPPAAAPKADAKAKTEGDATPKAEAKTGTEAKPEPKPPEPAAAKAAAPTVAIDYPAARDVSSGAVAAAFGPVDDPRRYCEAYAATAPPKQQFNARITIESECTVLGEPTSDADLSSAEPLPALTAPYRSVALVRTRAPYREEGETSWDDFEEIRVAIITERGAFVEQRGIEIADHLPASAVAIRKATVEDVVTGGDPELRIVLEQFVGADEGVPEQYQVFELVCGFGAAGGLACARFESDVQTLTAPNSPVTPEALRKLVLP